jgi:hypothetical protein
VVDLIGDLDDANIPSPLFRQDTAHLREAGAPELISAYSVLPAPLRKAVLALMRELHKSCRWGRRGSPRNCLAKLARLTVPRWRAPATFWLSEPLPLLSDNHELAFDIVVGGLSGVDLRFLGLLQETLLTFGHTHTTRGAGVSRFSRLAPAERR